MLYLKRIKEVEKMKKIEYRYSNGTICEHTIYIKPKTIKKECGNSKQ